MTQPVPAKKIGKIKNKFLVVFLIVGLVPIILMGLAALRSVSKTHRVDVSSLELQLLGQKREELQKLIDETVGIFQLQVGFEQTAAIAPEHQQFLLEGMLAANKHLEEVSFIDMQGRETKKLFRGLEDNEAVTLLNVAKLEKFIAAKKGKDHVGQVYHTLEGPMITFASPVKNKNGIVIMVLTGEMDLSIMEQTAASASLGSKGYFYILDEKGRLVAHSMADRYTPRQFLGGGDFAASVLKGERRTGFEDEDRFLSAFGEEVIGAGFSMETPKLSLIVEWPEKDAFAVIRAINMQLYGIAALVLAFILMLTLWVSRKIARPILVLKEGAKMIGGGQFDYRIQIRTNDELEDLGESFNKMAVDLAMVQKLREQAVRAEALQKSLEKEKELSHNKDSFIANASHQLRTPLATISWSLESAVSDATGDVEKIKPALPKTLGAAYEGIQSLNEILNDLLAVSEYGFGYREEKREAADLDPLIQEVAAAFQPLFQKKSITYSYEKKGAPGKAMTNGTVIKKAFQYLFDNAAVYSNKLFQVSLKEDGNELIIALTDDGIGIPEDDKKMIFTQFFRAKNAIVKKNVGTGLGLFIGKNIIDGLDGKIWFESQENKGSTFFIAIPKSP